MVQSVQRFGLDTQISLHKASDSAPWFQLLIQELTPGGVCHIYAMKFKLQNIKWTLKKEVV